VASKPARELKKLRSVKVRLLWLSRLGDKDDQNKSNWG
jgi:hypothetical protein